MGDWDFGDTSETLILISADGYHLLDSLKKLFFIGLQYSVLCEKSGSSKNVQDIL